MSSAAVSSSDEPVKETRQSGGVRTVSKVGKLALKPVAAEQDLYYGHLGTCYSRIRRHCRNPIGLGVIAPGGCLVAVVRF